ncbi:MAG: hypothetical protein ACK51N_01785, partial [bacterium]
EPGAEPAWVWSEPLAGAVVLIGGGRGFWGGRSGGGLTSGGTHAACGQGTAGAKAAAGGGAGRKHRRLRRTAGRL